MIGEYDDDTHFCLKCHATILGLDNYVNHRKAGCTKNVVDLPKSPLPSQLLPPDESFNLKADDFFSSLELQSSSKKLPPSTSGKNLSGILTRSKTTAAIQASTSQKDQTEIPQSKSGKNVWIGGHQLKLGHGDNQTRLIKAVSNLERRKDDNTLKIEMFEESDESEEYEYEEEDFSDEDNHDAPPRNHTGGKWKPSSPIDWNAPPPSYTGGKWKPKRNSPPPSHIKGKWKPSYPLSPKENYGFPPPTFTGSKWSQSKAKQDFDAPPSSHTKGKWKPEEPPKDGRGPSPNYTKGKWIPQPERKSKITDDSPLRKSSGTVQYWCRPCNRRLASKIVYERHLKSELHYKRTLHDKEFDDNSALVATKRFKKKTEAKDRKRNRRKIYVSCDVCRSKVNRISIGKHLISHYHCRKGDIKTEIAQLMVLEYIDQIIIQSPYQCGLCKFYFNHEKDFLDHWLTEFHLKKDLLKKGYYCCSLCKIKNYDTRDMYNHLISSEHKEVVAVINRSVPIIIKQINPVKCAQCNQEFTLNISLKKHCEVEGHHSPNLEGNINNYNCLKCEQVFRSAVVLQRHNQNVHKKSIFLCSICNKRFESKEEAKLHRNSSEHRYKVLEISGVKERKCDYCEEVFQALPSLKEHLRGSHPELCPRCLRCGASFALPQELTVHLRTKSCSYKESYDAANSCDKCPFSSSSTSELIFHKVLHTEPLMVPALDDTKKPTAQYKCPLCQKFYPKASLQAHLRLHTKERPFVCSICRKAFVRKNNWQLHVKNHERKEVKVLEKIEKQEACGDRPFLCSACGASFKRRSVLQQHMTIHSGKLCKCPKPGCIFTGRNMADIKQHFKTHSELKSYICNVCDYRGKTTQQLKRHLTVHANTKKYECSKCPFSARTMSNLKRHLRLHTGSKPFSCPHCNYKCNTLENLRKHILSTNKHKNKSIYECKFCSSFQTNFAKDFKVHLSQQHKEIFKSGTEIASFIAGIYEMQSDCAPLPENASEDDDDEKDRSKPTVIVLQQRVDVDRDPVVTASTSKDENNSEEIFPMFIVSRDDTENLGETWNVIGSYDVEESGNLVPFNSDNVLFQGPF